MKKNISILCALFILVSSSVQAKKVYVRLSTDTEAWSGVTENSDNVIVTISDGVFNAALANVAADDVVWVAKGVYDVSGAINLNGDRAGVKIYGGFKGNETTLEQRSLKDMDGNGIVEAWEFEYETQFKGNLEDTPSYRMFTMNSAGVVVDGITICDNRCTTDTGSGAFLKNNAVLSRCIVRNVTTAWTRDNNAVNGGGLFVDTTGKIESCLIENCTNDNSGSGGSAYGGGVNISGIASSIKNTVVRNCLVTSTQNALGGGIFINNGAAAENCVIYNNNSVYRGGGVYVHNSGGDPVKLVNLTVVNNQAAQAGGGLFCNRGTTYIYNSIFWGNINDLGNANNMNLNQLCYAETYAYNGEQGAGIWMEEKNSNPSPAFVTLIPENDFTEEITEGLAPRFTRPTTFAGMGYEFIEGSLEEIAKANWSLQSTSDLIDKGVNEITNVSYTMSSTDICGNTRPNGASYDLGAYEFKTGGSTDISIAQSEVSYRILTKDGGVKIEGIEGLAKVNVFNALGMLVKTVQISDGEFISLSQHGIYVLTILGNTSSQSYKIVY